jgi:hypothetical protein
VRSLIATAYLTVNESIATVELATNCRNAGLGVLGRGNEKDRIFRERAEEEAGSGRHTVCCRRRTSTPLKGSEPKAGAPSFGNWGEEEGKRRADYRGRAGDCASLSQELLSLDRAVEVVGGGRRRA